MSQLGQWLFEQQKQKLTKALDQRLPSTGLVLSSDATGVTVLNPLTGQAENNSLVPLGLRPTVNQRAVLIPLADGERVVLPLGETGHIVDQSARGVLVDTQFDATPTISTNASLATFVEHASYSLVLPASSTWKVSGISLANYKNNTANSGARSYLDIAGTAGSQEADTTATANNLFGLVSNVEASGLSGTITIKTMYRAETGGTATARDCIWFVIAERTG